MLLPMIVSVAAGQVPQSRLALDTDVVLEIFDVEHRLGGVPYLPDHHGGDLDRVPALIVHFEPLGIKIPRPQGELETRESFRPGAWSPARFGNRDLLLHLQRSRHDSTVPGAVRIKRISP